MSSSQTSLSDLLAAASVGAKPVAILNSRGAEITNWGDLHEDALRMSGVLQDHGVCPGDRVAVIGETSRSMVTVIESVWITGAAVTVLPLPGRQRDPAFFSAQTRAKLRELRPNLVCGDQSALSAAGLEQERGPWRVGDFADIASSAQRRRTGAIEPPTRDSERLAVLQFTSGSTADPKAVMVPERCLRANVRAIANGLELGDDDRIMSWLPLYHDMGLIGMLGLAMISGTSLVLADPGVFISRPRSWMEWMSEFRASITCAPNSAYGIATRALAAGGPYDLGQWRIAINGAEPIDVSTFEHFGRAASAWGFARSALFSVYGLAEATLAVSFPVPGQGLEVDVVDRGSLQQSNYAEPSTLDVSDHRRFAFLGRPLEGFELRIRSPSTVEDAADREVGEIELRGASVTPGYWRGVELSEGAWLRTGDLGYMAEGQLVVCGRQKDIIIVAGRNLYPEELEQAAATVAGVRAGNVIAFGVELAGGREGVVVAAECRTPGDKAIRGRVWDIVEAAAGAPPHDVVLVEAGTLPKTSSGKLQRARCREHYMAGTLAS